MRWPVSRGNLRPFAQLLCAELTSPRSAESKQHSKYKGEPLTGIVEKLRKLFKDFSLSAALQVLNMFLQSFIKNVTH